MKEFQNVLVGLTLDPAGTEITTVSRKALLQARWVVERSGGRLTLFHSSWEDVVEGMVMGGVLMMGGPSHRFPSAAEPLLAELEHDGIEARVEISDERPWLAMARGAVRGETDLVIVAKRHGSSEHGRKLGTNTFKLMRKCPCPVWVVNPGHELLHRSVLAATDLSGVGDRAVRLASALAAEWECELHVVHALRPPPRRLLPGGDSEHRWENVETADREAQSEIEAVLVEVHGAKKAQLHIRPGRASDVITETVDRLDPDLLVMGTVSRTGVSGLVVGNTAERLIDRLDCALLTVKPEGFVSPVSAE